MDIFVDVPRLTRQELRDGPSAEPSVSVRDRVGRARGTQIERQGSPNSMLSGRKLREVCALGGDAEVLFSRAVETLGLSGRGHDRVLRVARTVADLAGEEEIGAEHVAEALNYRRSHLVGR